MAGGLITAILDKRELSRNFADFVRTTRARDLGRLLKVSARRVTYRAMELTPPFKGAGSIGDWGQQLRQGEIALARDLRKLFFVMEKEGLASGRRIVRKAGKAINGGGDYIPMFKGADGKLYAAYPGLFKPQATLAEMGEWHMKYRTGRGHARSIKTTYRNGVAMIGKMVVGRSAFARYLRLVRSRLGFAKAGWGRAWLIYKGAMARDGKSAKPPPSWIRRHFGKAPGNATSKLTGDHQFIEITNAVRYIRDKDKLRIHRGASQYEAATLARQTKAFLERKMANRSKKIDQPIIDI